MTGRSPMYAMTRGWIIAAVICGVSAAAADQKSSGPSLSKIDGLGDYDVVQINGVAAGPFSPTAWEAGTLHILPDIRSPLIAPRWAGGFRNIYAPSAVRVPEGWRVFYGAWDGVATSNDRIYSLQTADFLDLGERSTVIDHGQFIHVCNVSALRKDDGSWHVLCTAYPDEKNLNKPACFWSLDGKMWNGSPSPHSASKNDLITMKGYEPYAEADINGVNVLLFDRGQYQMYFGNWRDPGKVRLAHSGDGKNYEYDGPVLDSTHAVNDMRKFVRKDRATYLMGLHMNTDRLWYALSSDGKKFGPEKELAVRLGDQDRFIVAIGWVTDGDRLLGFLYGAGASPELNRNRIFARWLQKKVVLIGTDGRRYEPTGAIGPDRQVIALRCPLGPTSTQAASGPTGASAAGLKAFEGTYEVWSEDGKTRLAPPRPIRIKAGEVYQLNPGK